VHPSQFLQGADHTFVVPSEVLVVFIVLQRHLIKGVMAGSLKG